MHARKWLRVPEVAVLVVFSAVWAVGVISGLPVNLPTRASWAFVTVHYFSPLMLAVICQVALTVGLTRVRRSGDFNPWLMLWLIPFVPAVVFLHFNFKGWAPLINGRSYDALYEAVDQNLRLVLVAFAAARQAIASAFPVSVDSAYGSLFILAFFLSYGAHAIFDTAIGTRRVVFATSLVLLVGGVSYWIAPAVGPFIYGDGPNAVAAEAEKAMWQAQQILLQTRSFAPGAFTAGLAAMPSLHIANMLVFVIYARRLRWLWVAYLPLFFWIIIESVVSRYHYLVDLPAGALLALGCVYCSNRLLKERAPHGKQPIEVKRPKL